MTGQPDPLPEAPVWLNREVACAICGHEWVAVYPRDAVRLQCPTCGHPNTTADVA